MGLGANLTPSEARDRLVIPVIHVLLGIGIPIYETTSVTNPSGLVSVRPKGIPAPRGVAPLARVTLNGKQWEKAVVPVLTDPRWEMSTPINRELLENRPQDLIALLGEALFQSFQEAGYGPR